MAKVDVTHTYFNRFTFFRVLRYERSCKQVGLDAAKKDRFLFGKSGTPMSSLRVPRP